MKLTYHIGDVAPYINWAYFYHAWQLKQAAEQKRIREEAERLLQQLEGRYQTYALFRIEVAHGEDDAIILDHVEPENQTIPLLRQQGEPPCLCLADFVHPQSDTIGLFATTVDHGMETDFDSDPYRKMMVQLLADRLAEATAERMHEEVRKRYWGYAPDEQLSIESLHQEAFQGIRPAVGYPSLPDVSINFLLDRLLGFNQIGIRLTESGAMRPHASVSGLMIRHPQARYFSIGKIGEDQLESYADRRKMPVEKLRIFLAANL